MRLPKVWPEQMKSEWTRPQMQRGIINVSRTLVGEEAHRHSLRM